MSSVTPPLAHRGGSCSAFQDRPAFDSLSSNTNVPFASSHSLLSYEFQCNAFASSHSLLSYKFNAMHSLPPIRCCHTSSMQCICFLPFAVVIQVQCNAFASSHSLFLLIHNFCSCDRLTRPALELFRSRPIAWQADAEAGPCALKCRIAVPLVASCRLSPPHPGVKSLQLRRLFAAELKPSPPSAGRPALLLSASLCGHRRCLPQPPHLITALSPARANGRRILCRQSLNQNSAAHLQGHHTLTFGYGQCQKRGPEPCISSSVHCRPAVSSSTRSQAAT